MEKICLNVAYVKRINRFSCYSNLHEICTLLKKNEKAGLGKFFDPDQTFKDSELYQFKDYPELGEPHF